MVTDLFSAVQSDTCLLARCRYIDPNPVRARMVAHPPDYPWSRCRARFTTKNKSVTFLVTFLNLSPFCSSSAVLGTLVIQGLTLRPLILWLKLPHDDPIASELTLARSAVLKTAMRALDKYQDPAAERLKIEYQVALKYTCDGQDPRTTPDNRLRQDVMPFARHALSELRIRGTIGDEAYRRVEQELDWVELSARP